jgi:hypothetical protein
MRKPGHGRLTWRTAIAGAASVAAVVAGGGYALASTGGNQPQRDNNGVSLSYLVGSRVSVDSRETGEDTVSCPRDMYPVGGGFKSSRGDRGDRGDRGGWEVRSSYPDSSDRRGRRPDAWTVSLFNNGDRRAEFRVYAVCSKADSVDSNY